MDVESFHTNNFHDTVKGYHGISLTTWMWQSLSAHDVQKIERLVFPCLATELNLGHKIDAKIVGVNQ